MAMIKTGPLESRRNCAACFKTVKTAEWQGDYSGVLVLEDGQRFWVNIFQKTSPKGDTYFGVELKPKQGNAGGGNPE
jgi:hypothetical protein